MSEGRSRLRELVEDGGVHVLDGAMGTVLYQNGVFVNKCFDELNLSDPEVVLSVHAEYVRAGAELIETNSRVRVLLFPAFQLSSSRPRCQPLRWRA